MTGTATLTGPGRTRMTAVVLAGLALIGFGGGAIAAWLGGVGPAGARLDASVEPTPHQAGLAATTTAIPSMAAGAPATTRSTSTAPTSTAPVAVATPTSPGRSRSSSPTSIP
ncbi:MAG TPA: hypothetical protein PKC36_03655, partial [Dietzia sp.]|nr:hypothetical protein [Dietzia sp.]